MIITFFRLYFRNTWICWKLHDRSHSNYTLLVSETWEKKNLSRWPTQTVWTKFHSSHVNVRNRISLLGIQIKEMPIMLLNLDVLNYWAIRWVCMDRTINKQKPCLLQNALWPFGNLNNLPTRPCSQLHHCPYLLGFLSRLIVV